MSRKCIIEKYLHQLNFSGDKFIVMADDFKMIADLALKQLAISKTETTSAKKIVVDIQLRPMLDELEVDIDDVKEYISKLN